MPFLLGLYWRAEHGGGGWRRSRRLRRPDGAFVLTPKFYGADNTLWYVENDLIGAGFDGWPVFLATAASLAAFLLAGGPTTEPEPVGEPREPEVTAALPAAG